jgi:hypothetical protein
MTFRTQLLPLFATVIDAAVGVVELLALSNAGTHRADAILAEFRTGVKGGSGITPGGWIDRP